mmetsp:Transcript_9256/g.8706  ORF Transcript_9256/g.8706 Transcript_9256/m.8706 type:complete len:98 (+) Transcript_9256:691-984(+)
MNWKTAMESGEKEINDLKALIQEVEEKNRQLNEKLNQVIYSKADAYKQKTLMALRRGESPERLQKADAYGIPHISEQRLEQAMEDEKMTSNKAREHI